MLVLGCIKGKYEVEISAQRTVGTAVNRPKPPCAEVEWGGGDMLYSITMQNQVLDIYIVLYWSNRTLIYAEGCIYI